MAKEQLQNLTEAMYYILLTLTEPRHGYAIMQEVEKISQGSFVVGPGTLYRLLARFEKENIIRQYDDDGRRKSYLITEKGYEMLQAEYQRLKQLVESSKNTLE
ncbi:MAG: PadR family transcriptional regulator [Dethiobacteraceae bacterium]|jgi:DNA-binding PadR family transcriptional regulator|nr:helix-turn-helix transcriptional regulator [Bacillota bacterium]